LTFSSELVFDGARSEPYVEHDRVAPVCMLGRAKAEAERRVLELMPDAFVVRTSALFAPDDAPSFASSVLRALEAGHSLRVAHQSAVSPTYIPHLVSACLDLLVDDAAGLWHLANRSAVSWAEFALLLAKRAGLPEELLEHDAPRVAQQAATGYRALGSERAMLMPTLDDAIERFFHERPRAA
jgi:dTDP-4-dehydrorhamnose reductase